MCLTFCWLKCLSQNGLFPDESIAMLFQQRNWANKERRRRVLQNEGDAAANCCFCVAIKNVAWGGVWYTHMAAQYQPGLWYERDTYSPQSMCEQLWGWCYTWCLRAQKRHPGKATTPKWVCFESTPPAQNSVGLDDEVFQKPCFFLLPQIWSP